MTKVVLTSDEVKVAIARFAAEKAGWGWHSGVEVKGGELGKGIVAELRDGHEASVLLTAVLPERWEQSNRRPVGNLPSAFGADARERLEEQIAAAVFRPDVVPVPATLMAELGYPETMDELVDKHLERLESKEAIEALGGVVIGPTAAQLDWLLASYLRAQPFAAKALPSRVTVIDVMVWLRKQGR